MSNTITTIRDYREVDGEAPEVGFFRTAKFAVAGRNVLVSRHGMTGHRRAFVCGIQWESAPGPSSIMARTMAFPSPAPRWSGSTFTSER